MAVHLELDATNVINVSLGLECTYPIGVLDFYCSISDLSIGCAIEDGSIRGALFFFFFNKTNFMMTLQAYAMHH